MKKTLSLFMLLFVAIGMFGQTNLFNPATASVESTYFATGPNWETETSSSASYDPNTGTLLVDLKSQFSSQWQAQVKLRHNVAFRADKQYVLSMKFHATAVVGGVTIKMDDNDPAILFQQVDLPANEDFLYTSAPCMGVTGNNGVLVFDFGWAPPCQITITEIAILEKDPTVEGVELFDPAAVSLVETYFAPNWTPDGLSSATYDANTGTISVDIQSQLLGQWQGQVKIKHNILFSAAKQYTLSCKFHATAAVGGVTVKMDDDAEIVYANQSLNLPANEDFIFISAPGNGVDASNQIIVFDFGYAGPCQITISNISVKEVGEAVAPPVVEHPEAAPVPTWKAEQVFSIYSDTYTSTVSRVTGSWSQTTKEEEVELAAGDKALYYTTCNYLGWEFNSSTTIGDMSAYPMLHMDVYVAAAGSIGFTPIWGSEAAKTYTLQAGWNSIDIDLAAQYTGINLANIFQMKWDAMPATCYIDNVYFYNPNGTAVDNIVVNKHAVKRIENGQLIIIRDGIKYDITGSVIR